MRTSAGGLAPCRYQWRQLLNIFWNSKQHRLRCLLRLGFHLLAMLGLMFPILIPVVIAMGALDLGTDHAMFTAIAGSGQALAIVLSVLAANRWLDRRRAPLGLPDMGFRARSATTIFVEMGAGLLLGALAMSAIFGFEWSRGWIEVSHFGAHNKGGVGGLMQAQLAWLLLMIFVGFSEELLSRGYHLKNLSEGLRSLGSWPAVMGAAVLSSLFFGVLHAANDNATLLSSLSVAMAGMMLAIARIATGNLAAPIGLHISWNLFQGPVFGFPVSGQSMEGTLFEVRQLGDPRWTGGSFGPEAGLLGIVAVIVLAIVFASWGMLSGRGDRNVAELSHYRPRTTVRQEPHPPEAPHRR